MKFIIFVIDDQSKPANAAEMDDIDVFNEYLQENGHWITAAGIHHGTSATVIDNRGGKGNVTSGSLYNQEEHYSGFWIIEASSHEVALDLAAQGSKACNRKVELRPYLH
ncbi:MAG: hypothetical protein RLZZ579_471 [Actinomycetota bacterium]